MSDRTLCFVNGISCCGNTLSVRKGRGERCSFPVSVPSNGCIHMAVAGDFSRYRKIPHLNVSREACFCCGLIFPLSSTEHHSGFYSFSNPFKFRRHGLSNFGSPKSCIHRLRNYIKMHVCRIITMQITSGTHYLADGFHSN